MTDLICDGIFDARLVRENKSAKGIFWTIEIAADDYYRAKLENLRPNAVLKLGYQELTDVSVQPIEHASRGDERHARASSSREPAEPQDVSLRAPEDSEQPSKHDRKLSEQCALRCKDKRFWEWLRDAGPFDVQTEPHAVHAVYRLLSIASRAELDTDASAAGAWRQVDSRFQSWLTERQHAGLVR